MTTFPGLAQDAL